MTDTRKRLIALIDEIQQNGVVYTPSQMDERYGTTKVVSNKEIADHLIANGVTIIETPKPRKALCILWNPGHHGLNQRCEQQDYKLCSCNGDVDKCDYRR